MHPELPQEMPARAEIPNEETARTIIQADAGVNLNHYRNVSELMKKIEG